MNAQADARVSETVAPVQKSNATASSGGHAGYQYRPFNHQSTQLEIAMNRNQRRMAAYNAMKSAQALELSNYTRKIDNAFSRLSGEPSGRVAKALKGTLTLRSKREESGGVCLAEVAIFAAGHRGKTKSIYQAR